MESTNRNVEFRPKRGVHLFTVILMLNSFVSFFLLGTVFQLKMFCKWREKEYDRSRPKLGVCVRPLAISEKMMKSFSRKDTLCRKKVARVERRNRPLIVVSGVDDHVQPLDSCSHNGLLQLGEDESSRLLSSHHYCLWKHASALCCFEEGRSLH
jgi:hypothetical protein